MNKNFKNKVCKYNTYFKEKNDQKNKYNLNIKKKDLYGLKN